MTNRSKAKGTKFETLVVTYLQQHFPHAQRATLTGNIDRGDVTGVTNLVIQCKDQARDCLGMWVDAMLQQRMNARADHGIVVHKRRGKARAEDQFVTMPLADFVALYAAYSKAIRDLDRQLAQ